jgi:glycosyltransferase involved in cell wall biosynthesis
MSTVAALIVTNRPHFIEWWSHQIGKQTRKPDEVIIVTNATDLEAYDYDHLRQRLGVENVVVYKQPPESWVSLGWLRQKAMDLCSSELFLWFDDDDWYHPRRLETTAVLVESGRCDAAIFPMTHTYYVEEGVLCPREAGIGIFLPAATWRRELAKKAFFPHIDLGEDGVWLHRVVHTPEGVKPFIYPSRISCVSDYVNPNFGSIILVHSHNVWQYPFSQLDPQYTAAAAVPWPKWPPRDVSKEEWEYTREMLQKLAKESAERAAAITPSR